MVLDGINGYIFKAGDINHLIRVLKKIDEHRNTIPVMKQESKKMIRGFTIERVAETIERVVNK